MQWCWLHQCSKESSGGKGTKSWGSVPARQWQDRSRATDFGWESCGLRAARVPCRVILPAVCHASSIPGTQAVFQKEWQTLKMNWSWQYGYIVSFSILPPKEKSKWKRAEKNIKQYYKYHFHCLLQWQSRVANKTTVTCELLQLAKSVHAVMWPPLL